MKIIGSKFLLVGLCTLFLAACDEYVSFDLERYKESAILCDGNEGVESVTYKIVTNHLGDVHSPDLLAPYYVFCKDGARFKTSKEMRRDPSKK